MDEQVQGAPAQLANEPVQQNQQEVSQQSAPAENSQEHNWKEARRSLEEKERRIQELEYQKRLLEQAHLQAQAAQAQKAQAQDEDIFRGREDDDILTVAEARKLAKKLEEKSSRSAALSPEDVMRIRVKDYDEVVSPENVKTYFENNPSLINLVQNSQNPYQTAYELIKTLKGNKAPAAKAPVIDEKKLEAIAQKPKSPNSVFADSKSGSSMSSREQIEARRKAALERAKPYLGSI